MVNLEMIKSLGEGIRVLYAEDDKEIRPLLSNYFKKMFDHVESVSDGQEGLSRFKEQPFDLVITDIQMPYMNGLEMLAEIKGMQEDVETIVVTAFNDTRYMADAIRLGTTNYILKPIEYNQMNLALYKSISHIRQRRDNEAYKQRLEARVVESARELLDVKEHHFSGYDKTLDAIVDQVDHRALQPGHSRRVTTYAVHIAEAMGQSPGEIRLLERAAMLHDLGKMALPDSLLLMKGVMQDPEEFEAYKAHVNATTAMLLEMPYYSLIQEIMQSHHEHYDGSGYPEGKRGDAVSILGHILIVANAFDNMVAVEGVDPKEGIKRLQEGSGNRYHPKVVSAALKVLEANTL